MNRTLVSLALIGSIAGACSGEPSGGDASFATATPEQRDEAIYAAMGTSVVLYSFFMVLDSEFDSSTGCPAAEYGDGVITYTGGCTTPEGKVYEGTLTATNFSFDLLEDERPESDDEPLELLFDQYRAGDVHIDGRAWNSAAQPIADYTSEIDIALTTPEGTITFAGYSDCTVTADAKACNGEALASLSGVGSFTVVSDSLSFDAPGGPTGVLELRGLDTLRVDFDAGADTGTAYCTPYSIDGTHAGDLCLEQPEPEPPVDILGVGLTCESEELESGAVEVEVGLVGTPDSVTVTILQGGEETTVELTYDSYDEAWERDIWSAVIANSGLECGSDHGYRIVATVGDETVCQVRGAAPDSFVPEGCEDDRF